ncbi:MAG: TetR/AcrR family transcriptional regulator [Sphingobacteriales bacterium]|jgi:AcrR family transcriptional regulator|nr:TetR/AcrR family transcriptional regulator [Sphingobacteriales bacterium]
MGETIKNISKEQIISAAAKLFRQKGYASSSMRDIASSLHIEAASLYHHIKNKEEILEIICFSMAKRFLDAIAEVNDIYFNAEEKLRKAILFHVEIITEDIDKSAVFLREWRSLPDTFLQDFLRLRNQYESDFTRIIENGIEEDLFETTDKKFAVLSILSSVNWINEWYQTEGKMRPNEIAERISDFVMGGLRKKLVTDIHYRP